MITRNRRLEMVGVVDVFTRKMPPPTFPTFFDGAESTQPPASPIQTGNSATAHEVHSTQIPAEHSHPTAFAIPSSFALRHSSFARLVVTLISLITSFCYSENQPSRKELWVPSEHLNEVLKGHPNAVLLSPEQYDALIRDAGKVKPPEDPKNKPPIALAIESLHLSGKLDPLAETIRLTGTLNVFSTSADWAQLDLPWHLPLLSAKATGQTLVSLSPDSGIQLSEAPIFTAPRTLHLHVKGLGRHSLTFETQLHLKHDHSSGWHELYLCGSGLTGYLDLDLPANLQLLNSSPFQTLADQKVRLPLVKNTLFNLRGKRAGSSHTLSIPVCAVARWTRSGLSAPTDPPSFADSSTLKTKLSETEVLTEQQLSLYPSAQQAIERSLTLKLSPKTDTTSVLGNEVLRWHQEADQLHLTLAANAAASQLTLHLRSGLEAKAGDILIPHAFLPNPCKANIQLTHSEGLELLAASGQELTFNPRLQVKELTAPLDQLPVLQTRPVKARLEVDADTLLTLDKDSLNVARTLNLRTDRTLHELRLTLPEGEEFIRIESTAMSFEWKRIDRTLELRFPEGVTPQTAKHVDLHTRQKLLKAWSAPRISEQVSITSLSIPAATKIAGYSALTFNDAWRVALKDTTGLEDRDAKLAPVKGRMAWFGLRDWKLSFEVERAEPVFSAEITAYALPRARTVEIEGQLTLDITGAPLRSFQLKLPVTEAKLLRLTSTLISEQQLDEATGLWTYTLRQESTGRQPLRFRLSLPAQVATGAEQTLQAKLPAMQLPAARRFAGTWVIEANTDTQVSFETQSLQPLDVLRAPPIQDYQPRHRLIAAYTYSSGQPSLKLTARRHAHAELAAMVVNKLILTSVLSPDGGRRHEAIFLLHHTGEQFLPVRLPEAATLLALAVEHVGAKPVRGENGLIAIPLPANTEGSQSARVALIYEEQKEAWSSAGKEQLQPPNLLDTIPVLETEWAVHAPDGRHYEVSGEYSELLTSAVTPSLWSAFPFLKPEVEYLPGGKRSETQSYRDLARERMKIEAEAAITANQVKEEMERFILPRLQFAGATLQEAMEFLLLKWNEADGFSPVRRRHLTFKLPISKGAPISLDLKDVPFLEALRYITELAGAKFGLSGDSIILYDGDSGVAPMITQIFKITSAAMARLDPPSMPVQPSLGPDDPFASASPTPAPPEQGPEVWSDAWCKKSLLNQGIPFPTGSEIHFDHDHGELIVTNTQANMDMTEAFWESLVGSDQAMLLSSSSAEFLPPGKDPASYLLDKMNAIIFPQVQFNNATIEEALEYLRVQNRDLDLQETDPARRGVSFILKSGDAPSLANISLNLKDVSLGDALRYVTELAGMKYKVEPFTVLITPVTETATEQFTRIYQVPPDFESSGFAPPGDAAAAGADPFAAASKGSAGLIARQSSLDTFKSQGIPFPEGASAVFNRQTNQLIVKNTGPNLDLVEAFVTSVRGLAKNDSFDMKTKTGLISLDLDLPTAGQVLHFSGHHGPESMMLRYVSWERQLGFAMLAIMAGIGVFIRWGRRRPWRKTLLVAALFTFGAPLILSGPALALANSGLFGWLTALGGWVVWCAVEKISQFMNIPTHEEVPA
jgi:hypothetical protein